MVKWIRITLVALAVSFALPAYAGEPGDRASVYDPDLGWYKPASVTEGGPEELFGRAKALFNKKKYAEAGSAFKAWINLFPKNRLMAKASFYYAECLFEQEYYRDAHAYYKWIIDRVPGFKRMNEVAEREKTIGFMYLSGYTETVMLFFPRSYCEFGIEIIEHLLDEFPNASFAPVARFKMANYYQRNGMYETAIDAYDTLVRRHPKSDYAALAVFDSAWCYLKLFKGIAYSTRRLLQGRARLRELIEDYPSSSYVPDAKKLIEEVDCLLAEKDLMVGRFYADEGRNLAARIYFESVVRDYPGTPAAKEAAMELKMLPPTEYPDEDKKKEKPEPPNAGDAKPASGDKAPSAEDEKGADE